MNGDLKVDFGQFRRSNLHRDNKHFKSLPIPKRRHVMMAFLRQALPVIVLITFAPFAKAEDVDNPHYTFWSKSKPGATVVHKETTKLSGPAAASAPDGTDIKIVTYKLVEVNDKEFHVGLHIVFKDKASHDKYQPSEDHKKFIAEHKDTFKTVKVFDNYIETVKPEKSAAD